VQPHRASATLAQFRAKTKGHGFLQGVGLRVQQRARLSNRCELQVAATDTAVYGVASDNHAAARFTRSRTQNLLQRDQHAGLLGQQALQFNAPV
jgi:hypothetical protein